MRRTTIAAAVLGTSLAAAGLTATTAYAWAEEEPVAQIVAGDDVPWPDCPEGGSTPALTLLPEENL